MYISTLTSFSQSSSSSTDNRQSYKLEEPRRVTLKDMQRERKELMKGTSALGVVQQ